MKISRAGGSFEVRTPSAVAGVVGTDFYIAYANGVTTVIVFEGVLCVNPGSPTYPHGLNTQFGTIGFLDIRDGRPEASIWQITEAGIEPYNWSKWRRPW